MYTPFAFIHVAYMCVLLCIDNAYRTSNHFHFLNKSVSFIHMSHIISSRSPFSSSLSLQCMFISRNSALQINLRSHFHPPIFLFFTTDWKQSFSKYFCRRMILFSVYTCSLYLRFMPASRPLF